MITTTQIENIITKIIEEVLFPKFYELGMDASGEWLKTTKAKDNTIIGPDYTKYLTQGRPNGNRPPIAPLEKWVNNKFGINGKQATSIAFAISKTIEEKGTTWYQQGGTDLLEVLESREVYDIFVKRYAIEVKTILSENFKRELISL